MGPERAKSPRRRVAIIIPAYNEEDRVAKVAAACLESRRADEVIVVSDGSSDRTAAAARTVSGVRVIELPRNVGKGGAMTAAVRETEAEILAFVDADLGGLTARHIDLIIEPVHFGLCDMAVGVFRGGKVWSDAAQRISPALSGQRAMRRELFLAAGDLSGVRMGVEVALNLTARRRRARVRRVVLRGVSNFHKEQKLGLVKGLAARTRMYREITEAMVKSRRRQRKRPRRWLD